ncbi:MAG: hypothetical protein ACRC1K_02155 [Planctomycetia bacterium]
MTTLSVDELLGAIAELRALFPEWRLGQLIANLAQAAGRDQEDGVWDVEDDQMLAAARRLIERHRDRRTVEAEPNVVLRS